MRSKFDRQLIQLNNELIRMGNLIEQAIEEAASALVKKDMEKAQKTIDFDQEINEQEKVIEALCLKLLLQQQPVAKDLRLISSALKMITDMERIGDHAADISELTLFFTRSKNECIQGLEMIENMAKETMDMVMKSIEAFVSRDVNMALDVIRQDDVVDNLFTNVKQEVVRMINRGDGNGEKEVDLLMIAKYFERIGDHATNIAEWVIFAITGQHQQ